tara:strand:+ start:66500 stop:67288 length:789 start_codon:yes stop_codon:yes gene_type:complete
MKNSVLRPIVFKRPFSILLGTAMILTAISCSDDDGNGDMDTAAISEEEAAEAIILAVSPEAGGMTEESMEAIYILQDGSYTASREANSSKEGDYVCGEEYSSSYVITKESGSIVYDINYVWSWIVGCDANGNPISYNFSLDGTGVYATPRMSSSGSDTAQIEIISLKGGEEMYQLNEEFIRRGTQESFVNNENTFNSTVQLDTENLQILKSNYNIVSGTVSASFKGEVSNGNSYDFSGEVVFHGNQTATLTMGSGNTYQIAW